MGKISVEDWREVFVLLDTALDLPVAARAAWLDTLERHPPRVTGALRELLARQTADRFLQDLPQFTGSPDLPRDAAASESVDVGSTVGPYRLTGRLGRGGMSSVWVGERIDGMLKRRVAIKLPHVSWAMPEAAARMARERDLLASLEHPGIARLYDAGVGGDGRPYLALELVDGQSIDEYCAGREADIATRVDLVLQTARAVAYAHSCSIVHRDLKPSNILVDGAGKVRLLDFGIAKLLGADNPTASQDTQFAGRLFTPDYASPEQVRGEPVTAGTDVFSLGVVLGKVLGARPRSRDDLDTIIQKAVKESVSERYSSMSAFADDLDRFLSGEPVLAQPDSAWYRLRKFTTRNQRMLRAVGAAVACTMAIGIGFAIHQSRAHDASTALAVEQSVDAIVERSVPRAMPTRDVTAYREYLEARSLMLRPTEENLREIVRLAESATTRDPQFAHAFALLAGSNVLFLDIGFPRLDALARGEPAARRALELDAQLPGAYATLGSIAAHRGQWIQAEEEFRRAFAIDDKSGRIHARHAQLVLTSAGHLEAARRQFQAEFRLTPGHARGAMQVATALGMQPGHETEALKFVDIAMSLGWPADAEDMRRLYADVARRAGRHAEAVEYQTLAMPEAMRQSDGAATVRLLYEALRSPAQRETALRSFDALAARLRDAGTTSFASLMFCINGYAMLGDLDRAYAASAQWLQLSANSGLSGIPHNSGFWLPEMRAFRADPRFETLASNMGLVAWWRRYGAPDHCELSAKLVCSAPAPPTG
ncbi:MAG TPA: protein kinase [Steroidobacteraceae bacterium]|nr:protein kinase [Steroidobacteraceae bacterium]